LPLTGSDILQPRQAIRRSGERRQARGIRVRCTADCHALGYIGHVRFPAIAIAAARKGCLHLIDGMMLAKKIENTVGSTTQFDR
jgi:hypothetical protein